MAGLGKLIKKLPGGDWLGLFPDAPQVQPAPAIPPPTVMPTMDSAAVKAAQDASLLASQNRQGRLSTILTQDDNSQKLGG